MIVIDQPPPPPPRTHTTPPPTHPHTHTHSHAQLLAASTDTPEVHLAWIKTARKRGGLGYMQARVAGGSVGQRGTRTGQSRGLLLSA